MDSKTLHLHSYGRSVRALQLLLETYEPGLVVDGRFGPRTEHAVRAAQRKLAVFPADGLAGPHTLDELAKAAKATSQGLRPEPASSPSVSGRRGVSASLGTMAHQAAAVITKAGHGAAETVERAIHAVEKCIAGLQPKPAPVPPALHPVVQSAKPKAQREPAPPGDVADPQTMSLRARLRRAV